MPRTRSWRPVGQVGLAVKEFWRRFAAFLLTPAARQSLLARSRGAHKTMSRPATVTSGDAPAQGRTFRKVSTTVLMTWPASWHSNSLLMTSTSTGPS